MGDHMLSTVVGKMKQCHPVNVVLNGVYYVKTNEVPDCYIKQEKIL